MKSYKIKELIDVNPKSKIKVKDSKNKGEYIFFTSGEKTRFYDGYLCDGKNIFIATGGKANFAYHEGKAAYSTDCYSIRTKSIVEPKFLYYFLQSKSNLINKKMFLGAALKHLQKKQFENIEINLPTLTKQKYIINKLEDVFKRIEKSKNNISLNKLQLKYLINSIFNSETSHLKKTSKMIDACIQITDGSHFSPKTVSMGYPYITVRDIKNDNIDFTNCRFINKKNFEELKKNNCAPKKNDLLFSKDGTVGKVAIVKDNTDFVVLSSLAILKCNTNIILPEFLFIILKSEDFLNEAIKKKTGVAIRRIILKNLKNISIFLPTIDEQKKIINNFNDINQKIINLSKNFTKQLDLFKVFKNSLLLKYTNQ
jgi:type I restriction enzyme, S subunit